MSLWNNWAQQIASFVDTTAKNVLPPAPMPVARIDHLEVGTAVDINELDADLFPSSAVIFDAFGGATTSKMMIGVSHKQVFELAPIQRILKTEMTVKEAYQLEALAKLKFRKSDRGKMGLLILELKSGKELKFMMPDPLPCVEKIRTRMSEIGISGSVTKSALHLQSLKTARECYDRSREIETQFSLKPSLELAREMMELLRLATERFAAANDPQYEIVNEAARQFLMRADVVAVLDEAAGVKTKPTITTSEPPKTPLTAAATTTTLVAPVDISTLPTPSPGTFVAPPSPFVSTLQTPELHVYRTPGSLVLDMDQLLSETANSMHRAMRYSTDEVDAELLPSPAVEVDSDDQQHDQLSHYLEHIDDEFTRLVESFHVDDAGKGSSSAQTKVEEDFQRILQELDLPDFESVLHSSSS